MNLTKDQESAIQHIEGNLQLIACAGSGKTEVVARRVVNLLTSSELGGAGCLPENIIAFTFTEKAAAELKERIYVRCQDSLEDVSGLANMYVGTIHGFCLELLQSEIPEFLKYEVINEVQQRLLVDRNSSKTGLTRSTTLEGASLRRYIDTPHYLGALNILREDTIIDAAKLESCSVARHLPDYETLLQEKGYLDYSSILKEAVNAISENERLRTDLRARIRHVIVDEYQDVNPIQETLVSKLHELGASVCVVGDDDQTLYQWRGSDVENILKFNDRYPDGVSISLVENFRSSVGVVSLARNFIKTVDRRLQKEMVDASAQAYEVGDIVVLPFDSPRKEAKYIADTCSALSGLAIKDGEGERGISWSDMVVLLRSVRRDGAPIMAALDDANIPFIVSGMNNLFEKPETQAARQLFNFFVDEVNEDDLHSAWTNANLGLSNEKLKTSITNAANARDKMQNSTEGQFHVYNLQRQFMEFIETVGLREELVPDGKGEMAFYNLGKFSQVISDFESIHFHSNPVHKYETFARFLEHLAQNFYPEGWQDNSYATPDAVQIMTVHQSKGLQWPAVFIPQLVRNRFPNKGTGGRTAWHLLPSETFVNAERYRGTAEDERRLFYVAITRAQKFLHMTWAPTPKNNHAQKPSDFISDVQASKFVKRRPPDYQGRRRLSPSPKKSLENILLTFSDLKYFFECPYQFKLRILYGFNAPIDQALGYGKSLHDALAEVHKRALAGEDVSADDAENLVQRHLRTPYAYPGLRERLEVAAGKVLASYITLNSKDFRNVEFSEKNIEIVLPGGVSITGRIDLVKRVDTGEVTIVDLKSSERAQAENVTEAQLHVYALGYHQLTGRDADYVQIYELDEQKPKTRSVDQEFITEVKHKVRKAANDLHCQSLKPNPVGRTCKDCDFRNLCSSAIQN